MTVIPDHRTKFGSNALGMGGHLGGSRWVDPAGGAWNGPYWGQIACNLFLMSPRHFGASTPRSGDASPDRGEPDFRLGGMFNILNRVLYCVPVD